MGYLGKSQLDTKPYLVYTSAPNGELNEATGVTVDPLTKSIAQGGNFTFAASVTGIGKYDDAVKWSVEVESGGTLKSGTTITSAGKLTVDAAQATTKKLYVYATTANGIKSVPAVVTVTS